MNASSRSSHGITLVEVALSLVVTSVMLVGALRASTAARLTRSRSEEALVGKYLADELLAQVMSKPYQDASILRTFGLEPLEVLADKAALNDVDDFNGWVEGPPQDQDGKPMFGLEDWKRTVQVDWVSPTDPRSASGSETGAKKVTVSVYHGAALVSTRWAVRYNGAAQTSN